MDGDPIRKADNTTPSTMLYSGSGSLQNNDNFNTYYRSDSPITISNHNSNSNSDASDSDDGQHNIWLESVDSSDPVTYSSYLNTVRPLKTVALAPTPSTTVSQWAQTPSTMLRHVVASTEFSRSPTMLQSNISGSLQDPNSFANVTEFGSTTSHLLTSTVRQPKHKNLSFHDVEKSLAQYYSRENTFSSEVDILATYLKGQKNIYIQSNVLCKRKLNFLTIPALALTSATIIFAPFTFEYKWGGIFISVMNAVIALLLSMINYLKLESALEMYIYLTKQYEKMELSLELTNHKLIYIDNVKEQEQIIIPKIKEIENKISDIKESHLSILIPEEVKQIFPVICHINILSFIKKIENYKRNLIIQFKDVKNEIRYIRYKYPELFDVSCSTPSAMLRNASQWAQSAHQGVKSLTYDGVSGSLQSPLTLSVGKLSGSKTQNEPASREKNRLPTLLSHKEIIREELLHYKKAYGYIDEIFTREIKYAEYLNQSCFFWRKPAPIYDYSNPVIKELLHSVFNDE